MNDANSVAEQFAELRLCMLPMLIAAWVVLPKMVSLSGSTV